MIVINYNKWEIILEMERGKQDSLYCDIFFSYLVHRILYQLRQNDPMSSTIKITREKNKVGKGKAIG